MINWDLAPEGAEELVQFESHVTWRKGIKIWCMVQECWHDYVSDFKTIATRPATQQKTVADAWEYYQENGKICGYSFSQNKMLSFCKSNGTYCFVSEKSSAGSVETDDWQPICTREQFEAYVKEQEGEKWTHMYYKDKCRIKVSEPDSDGYIVIVTDFNGYQLCTPDELKPIKQTMSESEAWRKMNEKAKYNKNYNLAIQQIKEQYDII